MRRQFRMVLPRGFLHVVWEFHVCLGASRIDFEHCYR